MNVSEKAGYRQDIRFAVPDGSHNPEDYEVFNPIAGWIAIACRFREEGLVRVSWHRDTAYDGPRPNISNSRAGWEFCESLLDTEFCDGLRVLDIGELWSAVPE